MHGFGEHLVVEGLEVVKEDVGFLLGIVLDEGDVEDLIVDAEGDASDGEGDGAATGVELDAAVAGVLVIGIVGGFWGLNFDK